MSGTGGLTDNQVQAAIFVFAGAVIGKVIDYVMGRYGKGVDKQTSLESQLWAEIHDLRERYDRQEEKYFERIKGFQEQIASLEQKTDLLQAENAKLKSEMAGIRKRSGILPHSAEEHGS